MDDRTKKRSCHPYSVVHGFLGIDGALLRPVELGEAENWKGIRSALEPLVDEMIMHRTDAGLSLEAVPLCGHSTDTYGKHRLKLRAFYRKKYAQFQKTIVVADSPKGDAIAVLPAATAASDDWPTVITGDPMHDLFALRRIVTPAANDCRTFISDHQDCMTRLSAPPRPCISSTSKSSVDVQVQLTESTKSLLRTPIARPPSEFRLAVAQNKEDAISLKAFISSANVDKSQTWKEVVGSFPPRGTIARICRLVDGSLHDTVGYYNHENRKALKREIRRIQKWYRVGRRQVRIRRRGIIRDRQQAGPVSGVRVVLSNKVQAHYRRLLKPLRIEGMMKWRKLALATIAAGVPVQSGTVGVERLWAILVRMLPAETKKISPRWFRVLAMLMFVRYNFGHYRTSCPGMLENDPLMAQRLETMELLVQATKEENEECLNHLSPLFDNFI